jgi:hypothetical protein
MFKVGGARFGGFGLSLAVAAVLGAAGSGRAIAEPTKAAVAGFEAYASGVDARLREQHASSEFMVLPPAESDEATRLRRGEVVVERLTQERNRDLPGAMLHDWRGTAYLRGGKAADFERVLRDFGEYPKRFAPQVLAARVVAGQGDQVQTWMRVQQRHGITVTLDTTYDVRFGRLNAERGYSLSRSTKIEEIERPGMRDEDALTAGEEHGFLWRLNTYWSWEERDGGLYVQIESISLTRSIPVGLGWAIGPFVERVPRESLEFTLRAACAAMR